MKIRNIGGIFAIAALLVLVSAFGVKAGGDTTEDLVLCCYGPQPTSMTGWVTLTQCLAGPATPDAVNSCPKTVAKCEDFICWSNNYSVCSWGGPWKGVPKDCDCLESPLARD